MSEELLALSPLDGRYAAELAASGLPQIFSEYGFIKRRLEVEIKWLQALAAQPKLNELRPFTKLQQQQLTKLWQQFSSQDAKEIKRIEREVLHDIKALELWLGKKLKLLGLSPSIPFIHFGCTSEDINNLAYALMLREGKQVLDTALKLLQAKLLELAESNAEVAMTGRTHGQEATPTTLGKEMAIFAWRLQQQLETLAQVKFRGKFNGATGNYNAWVAAYPKLDWQQVSRAFVTKQFALSWQPYSGQIEPHDALSELLHALVRLNVILIDLCRDLWGYISLGYFSLVKRPKEVGSSTMPHKINPEKFENAEGNLELAVANANFLASRLPLSRWQRDLSDSTLQRNLGLVFGHSCLGYRSCMQGLGRLKPNQEVITADLAERWSLLAEPLQTLLRQSGHPAAYQKIKQAVRGKGLTQQQYLELVKNCDLPAAAQERLLKLTPLSYTGLASKLAKQVKKFCG